MCRIVEFIIPVSHAESHSGACTAAISTSGSGRTARGFRPSTGGAKGRMEENSNNPTSKQPRGFRPSTGGAKGRVR